METKQNEQVILDAEPAPAKLPARRRAAAVAAPLAPVQRTPMDLIALAVERGTSVEELDKLITLSQRMDAIQAQKAFVAAMARFKANPPTIEKKRTGNVRSDKGNFSYKYANLADVCNAIVQALSAVGISHAWTQDQSDGKLTVTCILTHEMGHSERTRLTAGLDTSGAKNNLQALGSTDSYLRRFTLLAATGLAVDDEQDDDGASGLTDAERGAVGDAVRESRARTQHKPADVAAANGNQKAACASLLSQARMEADKGMKNFGPYWRGLEQKDRDALASELPDLNARAAASRSEPGK